VLKQDQAASQVLKEAFNLSDGEEKFIVNAKIGQGILVTQEGRIPFYNFLSDEERRLFTKAEGSHSLMRLGLMNYPLILVVIHDVPV